MSQYEEVKKNLEKFIREEFLQEGYVLKDDESLFDLGIIDSLGMIKLLAFIEKNFSVIINPSEIQIDNFNTVDKIVMFITDKMDKANKKNV